MESGGSTSTGVILDDDDRRLVSIVDDDIDITELFHEALCENIYGISVIEEC